ncbi:MAG: hypothetical protein A4E25_00485 [Methanobacterium sp. PtaB.Bin024]|nr:MAG: hypothetical protein A4E25_00485 [Methanobacterium sp. PtaB.Bin024]
MNFNLLAAILSIVMVVIGLYEIFGLGSHAGSNYISTILFAIVFILVVKAMRNQSPD